MRGRYQALAMLALGAGLGGGVALERYHLSAPGAQEGGPEILYWVAPMDPNYRRDAPGKSPMGMDLVPVYEGQEPAGDPAEVRLSAAEINAIGVRTAVARSEEIAREIRTVGYAGWDEHRTAHVHTRVEGWIERLDVRAIGDRVEAGDLLFELFSPEVGAATAELVRAIEDSPRARIVEIAKNRLRSIGLSDAQIEEIARTREPARNIRIHAPQDGVVVALEAAEGMYLKPDVRAMTLTDPGRIWLIAEVFERDLGRLSPDMRAEVRFDHLPGEVFEGRIDYIYPELDSVTRTLPVRLVLGTAEGRLRPGMFGSVRLLPAAAHAAVTVPSEALIRTGRQTVGPGPEGCGVRRRRVQDRGTEHAGHGPSAARAAAAAKENARRARPSPAPRPECRNRRLHRRPFRQHCARLRALRSASVTAACQWLQRG
nr:efflux RND transporter periplasmic adaptor subunit [Mangrovicoccus ximenensis]